ncbi:MAG: YgfZ/GcvT domain-containing protein [Longimicrobiales bacterium]
MTMSASYGVEPAGYVAAREGAAVIERTDRALVRVTGREPVKMIHGLVTNDVAGAPDGAGVYALLLTPKGKMLADLRIFRRPDGLLLECAAAARSNVTDTMRKFVPPLFARWAALDDHGVLGVYGPHAREVAGRALAVDLADDVAEHAFVVAPHAAGDVLITRTRYAGVHGWDLLAPSPALEPMRAALAEAGAVTAGLDALDVLRMEAGRPRWGAELTEDVIPLEAGLRESAISEKKGCYTGQEVIIRILHRGHVNWQLRGMLLGEVEPPAPGTQLIDPSEGKKLARITSAVVSPRFGQTIALGYARRELTLPAKLRLERADGPEVTVVELPFAKDTR